MSMIENKDLLPPLSELVSNNGLEQHLGSKPPAIPEEIVQWLGRLKLLYGVPFHYLVPDIKMLPAESLKFFYLDSNWINCLIDGAYSIGRSTKADGGADHFFLKKLSGSIHKASTKLRQNKLKTEDTSDDTIVTGFLLNSAVVSGWPGLEVTGYAGSVATPGRALKLIRFDRLSDTVMIGLFCGKNPIATLSIHEPSESLHFGLENHDSALSITLRFLNGANPGAQITKSSQPVFQPVVMRQNSNPAKTNRVLNTKATAEGILSTLKETQNGKYKGKITSAELALEMIKSAEEVDFSNV